MSKISELSDGGSLQSTDYLIAVRSGGNVKVQPNGTVTGTTGSFSGNVTFADNAKAIFGAGSDLEIYHDGSQSYISDQGVGSLNILASNLFVKNAAGTEDMARFSQDGGVWLYYDNALKFQTTSTGIDVTGTVTADGLTVDGNASINSTAPYLDLTETDTVDLNTRMSNLTGAFKIATLNDAESSSKFRLNIDHSTGDISFYEDTGTTPKFFWDASAEALGLGTTSPAAALHIAPASGNAILRLEGALAEYWQIIGATNDKFLIQNETDGNVFAIENGNVGIGTTSPNGVLETNTTGNNFTYLRSGDANTAGIIFGNQSDSATASIQMLHSDNSLSIRGYNNAERMRIDSSGNVGIGTSSPSAKLDVEGNVFIGTATVGGMGPQTGLTVVGGATVSSGDPGILTLGAHLNARSVGDPIGKIDFYSNDASGGASGVQASIRGITEGSLGQSAGLTFYTGTSSSLPERMRIDSGGNLLVGKASATLNTEGVQLRVSDYSAFTRSSGTALVVNRTTTDGSIVEFSKDGAPVGSIGAKTSRFYFAQAGGSGISMSGGNLLPTDGTGAPNDNANDIGFSSFRFDDIYATNGTIQTSDANEKQDICALSEAEARVAQAAKALLKAFRWKDSVAEKGDDARIHFGIIAQDLQAAFEAEGLDAGRYAMFIHSTWTDEETGEERSRMGVRYSELLAFIIAAL